MASGPSLDLNPTNLRTLTPSELTAALGTRGNAWISPREAHNKLLDVAIAKTETREACIAHLDELIKSSLRYNNRHWKKFSKTLKTVSLNQLEKPDSETNKKINAAFPTISHPEIAEPTPTTGTNANPVDVRHTPYGEARGIIDSMPLSEDRYDVSEAAATRELTERRESVTSSDLSTFDQSQNSIIDNSNHTLDISSGEISEPESDTERVGAEAAATREPRTTEDRPAHAVTSTTSYYTRTPTKASTILEDTEAFMNAMTALQNLHDVRNKREARFQKTLHRVDAATLKLKKHGTAEERTKKYLEQLFANNTPEDADEKIGEYISTISKVKDYGQCISYSDTSDIVQHFSLIVPLVEELKKYPGKDTLVNKLKDDAFFYAKTDKWRLLEPEKLMILCRLTLTPEAKSGMFVSCLNTLEFIAKEHLTIEVREKASAAISSLCKEFVKYLQDIRSGDLEYLRISTVKSGHAVLECEPRDVSTGTLTSKSGQKVRVNIAAYSKMEDAVRKHLPSGDLKDMPSKALDFYRTPAFYLTASAVAVVAAASIIAAPFVLPIAAGLVTAAVACLGTAAAYAAIGAAGLAVTGGLSFAAGWVASSISSWCNKKPEPDAKARDTHESTLPFMRAAGAGRMLEQQPQLAA